MQPTSNPDNEKVFHYYGKLIEEVQSIGCDLLNYDMLHPALNGGVENIAPVTIFRHFTDLIDSISLLVKAGSGDTPKILLRAALEAFLYIDYILREQTFERSISYMIKEIHNEIDRINTIVKVQATIKANGYPEPLPFETDEAINAINNKKILLTMSPYVEVAQYLEKARVARNMKKSQPKWYEYDTGASNIEQLANKLGHMGIYEVFYRKWSGGNHCGDLYIGRLMPSEDYKSTHIVPIRYGYDVPEITEHALMLAWHACSTYLKGRIPQATQQFEGRVKAIFASWKRVNDDNVRNLAL